MYGRPSWGHFKFHFERGMRARGSQYFAPVQNNEGGGAGGAAGGGAGAGAGAGAGSGAGAGQGSGQGAGGGSGAGAGSGGSGAGEGGGAGAGQGQGQGSGGGQQQEGQQRGGDRYARENQSLRTRLKALRGELDTLLNEGGDGGGSPAGGGQPNSPEVVTLQRRLDELESRDKLRSEETRAARLESGIDKALMGLSLTDPEEARASLLRRVVPAKDAKVGDVYLATDGKVVTKIKDGDKEREVELDNKSLLDHKLLKPIYLKPKGVGGAGSSSAAGAGTAATGPADRSQISDPTYYKEHREQFLRDARQPRQQ